MFSPFSNKPKAAWRILLAGVLILGSGCFTAVLAQNTVATNDLWTVTDRAARKQNPFPADANSIAKGKELFIGGCLPCHGATGRGDGPAAAALARNGVSVKPGNLSDPKLWLQTDGTIFAKLTEGRTPMPAWGETLTEEQRWSVVNYVRTLAPKPTGDVANKNDIEKVESTNKSATINPGSKP